MRGTGCAATGAVQTAAAHAPRVAVRAARRESSGGPAAARPARLRQDASRQRHRRSTSLPLLPPSECLFRIGLAAVNLAVVFIDLVSCLVRLAQELGIPIVKLAAPELVSGISGESEQRIRQVFQFAQVCHTIHRHITFTPIV